MGFLREIMGTQFPIFLSVRLQMRKQWKKRKYEDPMGFYQNIMQRCWFEVLLISVMCLSATAYILKYEFALRGICAFSTA